MRRVEQAHRPPGKLAAAPDLAELQRLQRLQGKELQVVKADNRRLQRQVDRLQGHVGKELSAVRRDTSAIAASIDHQADALWTLTATMDLLGRKLGLGLPRSSPPRPPHPKVARRG